jgi:hypothetical protein
MLRGASRASLAVAAERNARQSGAAVRAPRSVGKQRLVIDRSVTVGVPDKLRMIPFAG